MVLVFDEEVNFMTEVFIELFVFLLSFQFGPFHDDPMKVLKNRALLVVLFH
jgi:hypothetical protein